MMGKRSLVSVVDDDESVRESLPDLIRQFGFDAEAFASAEAFLASDVVSGTSCLLLDIAMPRMSGPDFQQELTSHTDLPRGSSHWQGAQNVFPIRQLAVHIDRLDAC